MGFDERKQKIARDLHPQSDDRTLLLIAFIERSKFTGTRFVNNKTIGIGDMVFPVVRMIAAQIEINYRFVAAVSK